MNVSVQPQDIPRCDFDVIPRFTPYYMAVFDEPGVEEMDMEYENELYKEYVNREGRVEDDVYREGSAGDDMNMERGKKKKKGAVQEKYEKVKRSDEGFYQFKKRVGRCPQQVLRYRWQGEPLLSSNQTPLSTSFKSVPVCQTCNAPRVFELQLLSSIIPKLKIEQSQTKIETMLEQNSDIQEISSSQCSNIQENSAPQDIDVSLRQRTESGRFCFESERERLDFGAVYIFSCSRSCWEELDNRANIPREEFVVFQADPDSQILK